MKATDMLENEHRVIEQVMCCLEKLAEQSEKIKKLDCVAARDMIEFFRMFADRGHHAKEEAHLFAVLETHGMPRDGGPTGVMLAEHEMGRGFVGGMEKAVTAYEQGDASALKDFAKAARAYVALLREHIQKEDHCLFAMTNENLSDKEQEQLLEAFRAAEVQEEKVQGKTHDYYLKKAQDLARRFQVKSPDCQTGASSACGHSRSCSH
jgi:hemerythrin-like domain-containing protein